MGFPPYPDIERLVPHQGRMCLLDAVTGHGQEWVETLVGIYSHSVFAEENGIGAWVGLEYMAQTVGAWAGLRAHQSGTPVKIGFLIGVRSYSSQWARFPLNSELVVRANREYEFEHGLSIFNCLIRSAGQEVATGTLTVFQPMDPKDFLQGSTS